MSSFVSFRSIGTNLWLGALLSATGCHLGPAASSSTVTPTAESSRPRVEKPQSSPALSAKATPEPASTETPPARSAMAELLASSAFVRIVLGDQVFCTALHFKPKGILRVAAPQRSLSMHYEVQGEVLDLWDPYFMEGTSYRVVECRSRSHVENAQGTLRLDGAELFESKTTCEQASESTVTLPMAPPGERSVLSNEWCWKAMLQL